MASKAFKKECVLAEKECTDCGECNLCDLDPGKVCDNCCACIEQGVDYKSIEIDEIIEDESMIEYDEDLADWKYDESYIVDYSSEEDSVPITPPEDSKET